MKLVVTIKVPQTFQIANYSLCLTHSFKTHATFSFMFSCNMLKDESWKKFMDTVERSEHLKLHGLRIIELICSATSDWRHPLLLPVILLEDYVYNVDRYKGFDLSPKTTSLERQLGVKRAGRNANSSKSLDFVTLSQDMTVEERFEIMADINTTATDVVNFIGNVKWDNRYCQFLRDISKEIRNFVESTKSIEPKLDNTIETLDAFVSSALEHAETVKTRLDIQLNVVSGLTPLTMDSSFD